MRHEAEQFALLNVPESISPRLRWMRERGVGTRQLAHSTQLWVAYLAKSEAEYELAYKENRLDYCIGETEDAALRKLAAAKGWETWDNVP